MEIQTVKKVLIVSYYFPPCGGPGSIRILKFIKYLKSYGWQPVILTVNDADFHAKDENLLYEIPPDVKVFRTKILEPYQLYRQLTGKKQHEPVDVATIPEQKKPGKSLRDKIAEFIRAVFFIPDARLGWMPFALRKGIQIINQFDDIELIFSSAPPFTCHVTGFLLSKITGIPWVADFRDPWTQAYFYVNRPYLPNKIEEKLEKKLFKSADGIVSINKYILNDINDKYNLHENKKFFIIPNGYDSTDFENIAPVQYNAFTIVYTGSLNPKMSPKVFLEAIGELCSENREFAQNIKLVFVGRMPGEIRTYFENNRIKHAVNIINHVPHKESLKYLLSADLLLLIVPEYKQSKIIMTTKIFDYIKAKKPILALTPESEAANLIKETNSGYIVSPNDKQTIKARVLKTYSLWRSNSLTLDSNDDVISRFDRRLLTKKLAITFDSVCNK